MNFFKACLWGVVSLFFANNLYAQVDEPGLPGIKNYKRSDYKGGTQNWCIDQDKNNNLYFANNEGLFQFDGSTWKKFELSNNSAVRTVKAGDSNRIYVGGYDEFGFFSADKKGKLVYHSLLPLLNEGSRSAIDFIWKIHLFNHLVIFQSFREGYIYDGKKIKLLDAPDRFQFSFMVNNRLYFQDISSGLFEYKNDKLVSLPGTEALSSTEVWGMFAMTDNRLLITTQNKGAYIYEAGKLRDWTNETANFLKKNGCLGGVMIGNKFMVFNSVLDGMIVSDTAGKIIKHISQKNGLQNNTILTSFIDSKNNLWLGLDDGIDFINENSPITYFGSSYNLSTVYASVLYKRKLYVATNRGLFYQQYGSEDPFTLVEGTTGQAWNIQVFDSLLICAHNGGLLLIDDTKATKVLDKIGYWGIREIPGRPDLFLGSHYNGFAVFNKKNGVWSVRNYIAGSNKSASNFEVDKTTIWMIKDSLLNNMQLNNDYTQFKSVKTYKKLADSIQGISGIRMLDNKMYFQSGTNYYSFSPGLDIFLPEKKINALFKNIPPVRFVQEDIEGNIWYVYNESLGILKKNTDDTYQNITSPFAALKGNLVYNYLSVNAVDSKNVFIGLTEGLGHFDPALKIAQQDKPIVYARSFSFPGDTLFFGNTTRLITNNPVLPYQSNNVKFTFASPEYGNPESIEFSYQLVGFNNEWSNWTTVNIKEYTNLHEGKYKMYVRVRNISGIISEPVIICFTVSPPFYRHIAAYILYLLVLSFVIFLLHKRIKSKIRKNKYYETIEQRKLYLEKEARIKSEQDELEKEIERLKIEKLKISLLSKDRELVNNSLQVAKKNKMLKQHTSEDKEHQR